MVTVRGRQMISDRLRQIIDDGASRVRGEVDEVASLLVEARESGSLEHSEFDEVFTMILEVCGYSGLGSLKYNQCLKLLFPFTARFASPDNLVPWEVQLRELASRDDINRGVIRDNLLGSIGFADLASTRTRPASHTETDQPYTSYDFSGPPPSLDTTFYPAEFEAVVGEWSSVRSGFSVGDRAAWDFRFLQLATKSGLRLDANFAESLADDEDVWNADVAVAFVESLSEPLDRQLVGSAAAALLNSVLRYKRPRVYFRHPQSQVIRPIAEPSDVDEMQRLLVEEIGYPFVRALRLISEELGRAGKPPRRGMLTEMGEYITQVLERLGLRVDQETERDELLYSPIDHHSSDPVEAGEFVKMVFPGLVERSSGRRIFKAVVVPADRSQCSSESSDISVSDPEEGGSGDE